MAGYDNIKDHGFDKRTVEERRELAKIAGKASGRARRKKADFKKTLNLLLTTDINDPSITPVLEALGIDSTLESAVNMAMIKEAMAGNVKAYEAIAKYSEQSDKSGEEMEAIKADTELKKARKQAVTGESENGEKPAEDWKSAVIEAAKKRQTDE